MHNKLFKIASLIITPAILTICLFYNPASATDISETIAEKALYQGVYRCYTNGYIYNNISSLDNYKGTSDPMYYLVDNGKDSGDNYVKFVTGWTGRGIDVHDDYGLPCNEYFRGGGYGVNGSSKNLLDVFNKSVPAKGESNGVIKLTEDMGYTVTSDEDRCYGLKYTHTIGSASAGTFITNQVCQNDDGTLSANDADLESAVAFGVSFRGELCLTIETVGNIGCTMPGEGNFNGEQLLRIVKTILGSMKYEYDRHGEIATIVFDSSVDQSAGEGTNLGNTKASFKDNDPSLAGMTALNFLSGESIGVNDVDKIALTPLEVRRLYQAYLATFYKIQINCEEGQSGAVFDGTIKWLEGGVIKECHYDKTNAEHDIENVNVADEAGYLTRSVSLDQLLDEFERLPTEYPGEDLSAIDDSTNVEPTNAQPEVTCQNSGGAGSLGWIVCPILDWMANATEFMYDNIVEPALRIEPELFTTTGGQGQNAEAAWRIFRDFANIIFIILLLIVIFSQLTGYGIDNYGIKKILPKFIIVAVLVNLSYLICLICVDLSNIVGNSIQDVFNGMTGQISANITIDPLNGTLPAGATSNVAVDVGARAGIAAVTIAGLAVGAYALYSNPALLLTLFISVLGVLISVLFVFILLAGRKAAIVLLTVVSPIAFILYMLPNTKKIYDKWFNLWKAMLLVYPICGLLIGGGNFASQLMLGIGQNTSTPAASVFTAMIVGIVPIFFIPTVIKSAYAALGSIGGTLAGFGGRLRGGFTRGARNNELYKNVQKRGIEGGIRRKAGYDSNGNRAWGEEGPNRFQRFIRGGKKNIQRNALAYRKLQSEQGALDATNGAEFMLETETANVAQSIVASGDINSIDTMRNKLKDAIRKENRAEIRAYTDALAGKGKNGRKAIKKAYNETASTMTDVAAKAFADNLVNKHGSAFKENDRSMYEVASKINQSGVASGETTQHYLDHGGREALAGKLSAETIGDMDNDAIKEIFGSFDGSTVNIPVGDAELQKQIGAAAQKALSSGTVKDVTRQTLLQKITEKTGYTAPPTNVVMGNSQPQSQHQQPEIIVPENERAAEAALQEELRKRHQNGGGAKGSSGNNNVSPGGVILS